VSSDAYVPKREDKFSFGIWTVGWQGVDVFGGAVRPQMPADRAVRKLAELGAYGVNFHDNDVFNFDASNAERDEKFAAFRKALDETGLVVTTATTNLFSAPIFKDGGFTANERSVRRFALSKVMRNLDVAAELGAKTYVFWGGREGAETGAAKDIKTALSRYKEGLDLLSQYVIDQGYSIRFAIEPKPNEPRGDIILPTLGHAIAFINELEHPDLVGVNPEVGHEEMASLNYAHAIQQAMWHGKLYHIDLNGQNGPRYDQDLRFGAGNARGAFWVVDALLQGDYDGPVHFDYKPPRTENDEGVWESAAACMRNYLILREKATAFRADPEVQEAIAAARIPELAEPTLADGESWRDLREVYADTDTEALGARGMHYERLDQLALDYLYGVR
jgi:xylose isomerase